MPKAKANVLNLVRPNPSSPVTHMVTSARPFLPYSISNDAGDSSDALPAFRLYRDSNLNDLANPAASAFYGELFAIAQHIDVSETVYFPAGTYFFESTFPASQLLVIQLYE